MHFRVFGGISSLYPLDACRTFFPMVTTETLSRLLEYATPSLAEGLALDLTLDQTTGKRLIQWLSDHVPLMTNDVVTFLCLSFLTCPVGETNVPTPQKAAGIVQ